MSCIPHILQGGPKRLYFLNCCYCYLVSLCIHASNVIDVMQFTAVNHFDAWIIPSLANKSSFKSAPTFWALPPVVLKTLCFLGKQGIPSTACAFYLGPGISLLFPPLVKSGFLQWEMAFRLQNLDAYGIGLDVVSMSVQWTELKNTFLKREMLQHESMLVFLTPVWEYRIFT